MDKNSIEKFNENRKFFLKNASRISDKDKFAGKIIVIIDKKIDTLESKLSELIENPKIKDGAYMKYIYPKNNVYGTTY